MIVTFAEIINEVIRGLGMDPENVETNVRTSIKLRINEAQDVVFYNEDWEWRKRSYALTTIPPYTTGTISVTQGSRTVTGSATGWSDDLKRGYLLLSGRAYKIDRIVSGTSLRLVSPYDKGTESSLAYSIIYPDYPLNHEIASIISVKYQGNDIHPVDKARLTYPLASTGRPAQCAMHERASQDYFTGGSVSITNASADITGSGTTWTTAMEGMTFRVNEFSKSYTIRDVNSATSITLTEVYEGETGVGKSYVVGPKGTQMLTFRGCPNDYYYMEIDALIHAPRLVGNNDISLIPNHQPLIMGAIWLALVDLEAKNPIRIQQARADFERTLKQLKSTSRIITGGAWKTDFTNNLKRQFNPLER